MKDNLTGYISNAGIGSPGLRSYFFFAASLLAILCSFVFAESGLGPSGRLVGYAAILTGYLILCVGFLFGNRLSIASGNSANFDDLDRKLLALEHTHTSLAASVNSPDAFRLICSRIGDIVNFNASILYAYDNDLLSAIHKYGVPDLSDSFEGIAREACTSKTTVIGNNRSAVAMPLIRSGKVFAVLQLFAPKADSFLVKDLSIFEAIGERASGFVAASFSFDQSRSDALTDPVTRLPNERAFMIVLENQIAQSLRERDERPLSIITIDINNFDEVSTRSGHAAGDRLLDTVADTIKEQLRQMDFVARASDHDFLVILPSATLDVAETIIERIENAMAAARLDLASSDRSGWQPELRFGVASLIEDGETISSMLAAARGRRERPALNVVSRVISFPEKTQAF